MSTYAVIPSPVGDLLVFADDGAITGIYFPGHKAGRLPDVHDVADDAPFAALSRQLAEYFAGQRRTFDIPVRFEGGTEFQRSVWEYLTTVPYGETRSYGDVVAAIGARPGSARAVGAAVGRNPISIVVPCHRIMGSTGAITGYAGGVPAKQFLLSLESGARQLPMPL